MKTQPHDIKKWQTKWQAVIIVLFLVIVTFFTYLHVMYCDFVSFDDVIYVTENSYSKQGITLEGLKWAFTLSDQQFKTYWQPLTRISHMLDCQLFGVNPSMHHLVNLLFHIANVLLLYFFLKKSTSSNLTSAFIALLFALHPINVDTVAWISNRKNLLSTFFWLLSMNVYLSFVEKPKPMKYLALMTTLVLGLLAKTMLITLPFALLLLDIWPLKRISIHQNGLIRSLTSKANRKTIWGLVKEKIPLFMISLTIIYISTLSLREVKAFARTEHVDMALKIQNAIVSYLTYIVKLFWPSGLAVYYPFPQSIPAFKVIGAAVVLIVITCCVLAFTRKRPYLFVGWFWFLGTLVPVIGLVQQGLWPAWSDRWAYIPFMGLFVIIGFLGKEIMMALPLKPAVKWGIALAVPILLLPITVKQTKYWTNTRTLFTRDLLVTKNNEIAQSSLGAELFKYHLLDQAIYHYRMATKIKPSYKTYNNLGLAYVEKHKYNKAEACFQKSLQLNPKNASTCSNYGNLLIKMGRYDDAQVQLEKSISLQPDNPEAYNNIANAYKQQFKYDAAIKYYKKALQIQPDSPDIQINLGIVYNQSGHSEQAVSILKKVLEKSPDNALAHKAIAAAYGAAQQGDKAVYHLNQALRIDPNDQEAKKGLAIIDNVVAKMNEIKNLEGQISHTPDDYQLYYKIGKIYEEFGNSKDAIASYQKAIVAKPDAIEVLGALCVQFERLRMYDMAIEVMRRIITYRPGFAAGYYNIACFYAIQNKTSSSVFWLRQAIAKGYNNFDKIKTDPDLENIRHTDAYKEMIDSH